ncbi:MAG: hypothetical protein EZS28_047817, partial [Streblomastix strix]
MSKNSVKPEPSEPELFVNFDTPKFATKALVATAVEQPEMGNEIGKFLQAELQPTLQDIEHQLTLRQAVSERTQMLMVKVLEAMTGAQASEIDFWATNILDEQNGEAQRRQIQYLSLLHITSVPVPNENQTRSAVRLTKFCRTCKFWRYTTSEQAKNCWHTCVNNKKTIWQLIYLAGLKWIAEAMFSFHKLVKCVLSDSLDYVSSSQVYQLPNCLLVVHTSMPAVLR